jgi:hypothetical protein
MSPKLSRSCTALYGTRNSNSFPSENVGPLKAFTEEPLKMMSLSAEIINESRELRFKCKKIMHECLESAKKHSKLVDEMFIKRIYDTLELNV